MPKEPKESPIEEIRKHVKQMLDGLDHESPISAHVVFKVKKDSEDTFRTNADELTAATRKLEGCIEFYITKHLPFEGELSPDGDSVEYRIVEDWETVRHFRKQWDSDHLKKFQNSVFALLAGPPDLRFYHGWAKGAAAAHLPKTGQKECYDVKGKVVSCKGTGQDGDYQAGVPLPEPRFTDNQNGTITDNFTGLIWLKNANLFGEVNRDEAIEKAKSIASGSCGLSDDSKA